MLICKYDYISLNKVYIVRIQRDITLDVIFWTSNN